MVSFIDNLIDVCVNSDNQGINNYYACYDFGIMKLSEV